MAQTLPAQLLQGVPVLPVGLLRADLLYDHRLLLLELLVVCTATSTWIMGCAGRAGHGRTDMRFCWAEVLTREHEERI